MEKTTIQVTKDSLSELNRRKINFEAKLGKRVSMNDYIMEVSKEN